MKEFIDQNGIIREQRIKCYSYLYLHLLKPLFPFWVKLVSSKIANYDSEYKHNLVVQKGSVELLHSRNYSTSKRLRITMYGILQKCARARSLVFFSLLRQKFMNVTEIYNQFNKWKELLQAILTVFHRVW